MSLFQLLCICLFYGYMQQCHGKPGDVKKLSDYMQWIKQQSTVNAELPTEAQDALFTVAMSKRIHYQPRDTKGVKTSQWRWTNREGVEIEVPIQVTMSYHREPPIANTLVIDFWPSSNWKNDFSTNLETQYQRVELFSFIDETRNYIDLQAGLIKSLYTQLFDEQFRRLSMGFRMDITDRIEKIIITGHSLGGAYAQAFYMLLFGDQDLVPGPVKNLRNMAIEYGFTGFNSHIINTPDGRTKEVVDNVYDHTTDTLTIAAVNRAQMDRNHRIIVITTGAFLIIPTTSDLITGHRIIGTNHIYNLVEPGDPVPMVFGGNVQAQVRIGQLTKGPQPPIKTKQQAYVITANAHLLGTATTVGWYGVISKHDIKKLIDGSTIQPAALADNDHEYFTQHLKNGNIVLGALKLDLKNVFPLHSAIHKAVHSTVSSAIHWTFKMIEFGIGFQRYHNKYDDEIWEYISNERYYKTAHQALIEQVTHQALIEQLSNEENVFPLFLMDLSMDILLFVLLLSVSFIFCLCFGGLFGYFLPEIRNNVNTIRLWCYYLRRRKRETVESSSL